MKKILKTMSIVLLVIMSITGFLYTRYLSLDIYTWDTDNMILTLGEKQYKGDSSDSLIDLKLDKRIGRIQGEGSYFIVWSIEGESTENRIAINGFMYPPDTYSRIK